jgi:23S rRNA (adenine2503-C2)-methyltransferase
MTNISKKLQDELSLHFDCQLPKIINIASSIDGTKKFLLRLSDGEHIEMVLMPSDKKNALCISTQVGCARGCSFCATAKMGLHRDLYSFEILSQILLAMHHTPDSPITNIVLMGMGEPLDNYLCVMEAIAVLQSDDGFRFSGRRITLSTSGIVPVIYTLADSGVKIKLAVSLNSAIGEKRSKLMPVNDIYPLTELKKALQYFRKKTAFRITFEYILISGYNMGKEDIKALGKYCGDISCKLNLIQYNDISSGAWKSPTDKEVDDFVQAIERFPFAITKRKSRGADISGACGQLVGAI